MASRGAAADRESDAKRPRLAEEAPFPRLDITSAATLQRCRALAPQPAGYADDVFVCSYPKSGTTWMQHIVGSLVFKARGSELKGHISSRLPFFEIDPHWGEDGELAAHIQDSQGAMQRRMFNTHLRWELMPRHLSAARFIYVCREGKDACVSFFHHLSSQETKDGSGFVFEGSFAEFHQRWVDGQVEFGRWTDHLASWNDAQGDKRVLFVSYEDMISDLRGVVDQVVRHLHLELTDDQVDELMPTFSLAYMKANRDLFQPISVAWKKGFEFLRKGKCGDGATLYGEGERRAFRAELLRKFPNGLPAWAPYEAA